MMVEPSGEVCGAEIFGVELSGPLDPETVSEIRAAWLAHRVLAFPNQHLNDDALENFTLAMGGFGEDPFFEPIAGRKHIAAILREADETTPLFAENWHSDWSFLREPPAGTCLAGIAIPPVGGDTLFADQVAAFAALPAERKDRLRSLIAIHSARLAYAPEGSYGDRDEGRSMAIRPDQSAREIQRHPLVRRHSETGEEALFSTLGYIVGIAGMEDGEAFALLRDLAEWQTRDAFVHRRRWKPGMVVMWDNRSVLHRATGGYEGHRRELHRTTIAAPRIGAHAA